MKSEEAKLLIEESERRIEQAWKQKRRNDLIWFISQYITAISLAFALYQLFK